MFDESGDSPNELYKIPPPYIQRVRELYAQNPDIDDLIPSIKAYLFSHFDSMGQTQGPSSILESRFIPPEEAFEKGMRSCGTVVNIASDMLREVDYEVKKVHGSVPQSRDHAWMKVRRPGEKLWGLAGRG